MVHQLLNRRVGDVVGAEDRIEILGNGGRRCDYLPAGLFFGGLV
jgi:hypothetical protein